MSAKSVTCGLRRAILQDVSTAKSERRLLNGTPLTPRRNIKADPPLTPAVIFARRSLHREILDISGGPEEMWPGAMYHDDGNERLSEILVLILYDKTLGAFSLPSLPALSFISVRSGTPRRR